MIKYLLGLLGGVVAYTVRQKLKNLVFRTIITLLRRAFTKK